jgi:Holliday junction resolvasome RuvABC DNA-binding subunit
MISFIKGKIIQNSLGKLTVLMAGGVGYDIIVNIDTAEK